MGNLESDKFISVGSIKNRSLQKVTHLLCSPHLAHPYIPPSLHYSQFGFDRNDQYNLNFYKELNNEALSQLDEISPLTALGRYAERLLATWFEINPNFDLLAFNLQLIEDHTTIGEIDFLLWEKINQQAIHLEFALKFYLQHEVNGVVQYTGPKGRDTLEGKAKKLVDHQLKLTQERKDLLKPALRSFQFKPQLMLKGYIFYPLDDHGKNANYLRISQMNELATLEAKYGIIESRSNWIYPFQSELMQNELVFEEFKNEISNMDLPILSLIKLNSGNEKLLMIVEDQWPKPSK